jgi:hypothetical protein
MNVKFSQLPTQNDLKDVDVFPVLSDGKNYITPLRSVYTYLSGDQFINLYTQYSSNSSIISINSNKANSVYATYNSLSSNYVLSNSLSVLNWNSVYSNVKANSGKWTENYNYVNSVSSSFIFSNSTLVPNSSAIKNIVAITQANYNSLSSIDPQTYYVIASV